MGDTIDDVVDRVKRHKNRAFKQKTLGGNMAGVVEFHRDSQVVATVFSRNVGRDATLRIAQVGAFGYMVDALYFAHDAFGIKMPPLEDTAGLTDREMYDRIKYDLQPGELQARWNAGDRKDITEAVLVIEVTRNAAPLGMQVPYTVSRVGQKRRLRWHTRFRTRSIGVVPDSLADAIRSPNLEERLRVLGLGGFVDSIDPIEKFAHADVAVTRYLMEQHSHVGAALLHGDPHDVVRRRVITEGMASAGHRVEFL